MAHCRIDFTGDLRRQPSKAIQAVSQPVRVKGSDRVVRLGDYLGQLMVEAMSLPAPMTAFSVFMWDTRVASLDWPLCFRALDEHLPAGRSFNVEGLGYRVGRNGGAMLITGFLTPESAEDAHRAYLGVSPVVNRERYRAAGSNILHYLVDQVPTTDECGCFNVSVAKQPQEAEGLLAQIKVIQGRWILEHGA